MSDHTLTLTNYIDILDHLEASGNVPAGYVRGHMNAWYFYHNEDGGHCPLGPVENNAVPAASLCHTIEGVLMKKGELTTWRRHGGFGMRVDGYDYLGPSRLAAACAAYRAVKESKHDQA